MTLREFLLKHTRVCELCLITDGGWYEASAYIDSEDLFINGINPKYLERKVKRDHWDEYPLTLRDGSQQLVIAHVIDLA